MTNSGPPTGWNPPTVLGVTMTDHRNPRDSVSNDVHVDNFDPAEALESLHLEVIQLEAFANAAAEATTQLPFPSGREERRPFDRAYALVTDCADRASTLVCYGDDLIARLAVYRERRKAEATEASKA
jgi:hypothetical protein